jgi:hypothetical protein
MMLSIWQRTIQWLGSAAASARSLSSEHAGCFSTLVEHPDGRIRNL